MQKTLKTDTQGGEKALSSFLIKKATTEEKPFLKAADWLDKAEKQN